MPHDISNLDEGIFKYANILLVETEFLVTNESGHYSLATNYQEIASNRMKTKIGKPFGDFWLKFPLSIELILKSIFLKNHIDIFLPAKHGKLLRVGYHELSKTPITRDEFATGMSIVAGSNTWLQSVFDNRLIKYPGQVNTVTLGVMLKEHLAKLHEKGKISALELADLRFQVKHLADHRRNNSMHMYLMSQTLVMNDDLPGIYIPMLNKLLDIYRL